MKTTIPSKPAAGAIDRSAVYRFLAGVFAYPTGEQFARSRELATDVLSLPSAGAETAALAGAVLHAEQAELERQHVSVFTLSTSSDCPLYETAFTAGDSFVQSDGMADIAGFYQAFGVIPAAGTRPDGLTAELEFMSFLCAKEEYARANLPSARVRQARRAQRLFLGDHLLRWAPELGARVTACAAPGSPYWLAGTALTAWLQQERTRQRLGTNGRGKAGLPVRAAPAGAAPDVPELVAGKGALR